MGEQRTGPDRLRLYLSGADADGLSQLDHALSLGNFRSSARLNDLTVIRDGAMAATIRIDHAAGRNGEGLGFLRAVSTTQLSYTAPGGTEGEAVTIANGETKTIHDGTDANCYLLVTRVSTAVLAGSETIQLRNTYNNAIACLDYTHAQREAGTGKYRALFVKNEGDEAVTDVRVWFTTYEGATHRIAAETPVDGQITNNVENGETAKPSGLTWVTPTIYLIATLEAGAVMAFWIEHDPAPDFAPSAKYRTSISVRWTHGGTDYYGAAHGLYRAADDDLDRFELYRGVDAEPDLEGAPYQTADALPFTTAEDEFSTGHAYTLVTAKRNAYNLVSFGDAYTFDYDVGVKPSEPHLVTVSPWTGGLFRIRATYFLAADDDPATDWLIYATYDGTDPDPDVDTPTVVAMTTVGKGTRTLDYVTIEAQLEDTPVRVLVRTRRTTGLIDADSTNTAAIASTAKWFGPDRPPNAILSIGYRYGVQQTPATGPDDVVTWIDEANSIYWLQKPGETQLWAGAVLIWNLRYQSDYILHSGLYTTFKINHGAVSGSGGTSPIDATEWSPNQILYITVNGTRRVKIDVANTTITIPGPISAVTPPSETKSTAPAWRKYAHTCLQVWDRALLDYQTPISVDSVGEFNTLAPIRQKATQSECLS